MIARNKLSSNFFLALLFFFLYEACRLLQPFLGPLLCAVAVGIVFYPMHERFGRWFPRLSRSLQSLLSDLAVILFFLIPVGLLVWALITEAKQVAPVIRDSVSQVSEAMTNRQSLPIVRHLPPIISKHLDFGSADVRARVQQYGQQGFAMAAHFGTEAAKNTAGFALDLFVFLFALFFIFRDGEGWLDYTNSLLPLGDKSKEQINRRLHDTVVGVVRGSFLTALAQGAVATIGFAIVQVKGMFLLGGLTCAATLIPAVGTALVWVPVSIVLLLKGAYWKGIFLIVWGVAVIGLVDNILRPMVMGNRTQISMFWFFFALLGGIAVFGAKGLLLGPLIIGLLPVLLEIYRLRFVQAKDSSGLSR